MRSTGIALLLLLTMAALPAAADPVVTTVDDGCGDAHSSVTVDGERTAVEDPISPHGDIEQVRAVASTSALSISIDLCDDVLGPPENQHGYTVRWDIAPLEGFEICRGLLALRDRAAEIGADDLVDRRGALEITCDTAPEGAANVFERHTLVEAELDRGVGYTVDGDVLTFHVDEGTVGADAMAFFAPGATLSGVEVQAVSGFGPAIQSTLPPVVVRYEAFGDRVDIGDLLIPVEDEV